MPDIECFHCKKVFHRKPSHVLEQNFCSAKCRDSSRKISITQDLIRSRSKKAENSECWEWNGSPTSGGYGVLSARPAIYAHRASYEAFFGAISEGLFVLHTCDNRICVNPEHLYVGTHDDNMRDMRNRKRAASGERHPMATITSEHASMIREQFSAGEVVSDIALRFGVNASTARRIINGKLWGNAKGPTSGTRHDGVILTQEKADALRRELETPSPRKALATKYGISLATLYAIRSGRIWAPDNATREVEAALRRVA